MKTASSEIYFFPSEVHFIESDVQQASLSKHFMQKSLKAMEITVS